MFTNTEKLGAREDMDNANSDPLASDDRDVLATTSRAIASLIPLVGGVVGELITQAIPQQRTDRIVLYIRELEDRLHRIERTQEDIYSDPESIDLIEEGGFQAARATTTERISQIAELVAHGLAADDASGVRRKRLSGLLRELDNEEVLILTAYGSSYGTGDYSMWDNINRPDPAHLASTKDEIDAEALYNTGQAHLLRLGLLQKNYRRPRRGEAPEFDIQKGDFAHSLEISYLGRMLLRAIGQTPPFDEEQE